MITIRDMEESDLSFVYATWLKALYYGSAWYKAIDKDVFFNEYQRVIKNLLFKPTARARVATFDDEPDIILGWAVYEPGGVLHFVYIKPTWRKQGIAKQLLDNTQICAVTHITDMGEIMRSHYKLIFNPWLI